MAFYDFNNKKIYFEDYGSGKPIIVLNGIMMSTASWKPFIEPFSKNNRLILCDMLDQGKSSRMNDESYGQELQVEAVKGLIEYLKLEDSCVVGISYGGEVAQGLAVKYPELIGRLVLFNTTARTGNWLGDIGDAWNLAADNPDAYYLTTIPVIYSPFFYIEKNEWMNNRREILKPVFSNPDFINAMIRLTNSSRNYDVKNELGKIKVPTLVVSCEEDYLTPMAEQDIICEGIPNSYRVKIPKCGHASMYEQPLIFTSLVLGFCNSCITEFGIT